MKRAKWIRLGNVFNNNKYNNKQQICRPGLTCNIFRQAFFVARPVRFKTHFFCPSYRLKKSPFICQSGRFKKSPLIYRHGPLEKSSVICRPGPLEKSSLICRAGYGPRAKLGSVYIFLVIPNRDLFLWLNGYCTHFQSRC